MPSIVKYQKITDKFTTYNLVEPDYATAADRCIEIATVAGVTYVAVPTTVTLPVQPKQVNVTPVTMTPALKTLLKLASPHVRLIDTRVVEKIRNKYSINDEIKLLRIGTGSAVVAYSAYVATQVAWGKTEKTKLGL